MKQTIEYYYSIKVDQLLVEENAYHIISNNEDYYFVMYIRNQTDLQDLIDSSRELKNKNINCHDLILNNQKEVLTKIDDADYILLKVHNKDEIYSIIEMMQLNKKVLLSSENRRKYVNNWSGLWQQKIDYIETQQNEVSSNRIIKSSIDYYIGLCENAIYYVNTISQKYSLDNKDNIILSHNRVGYPNYGLNYLNPLSFIFDLEVRDVAEYIKSCFFYGDDAMLELQTYLKSQKLTPYSYNMLYARLLYPSYYFDNYEKGLHNDNEKNLINIITKVNDYEEFLKKAYKEISLYAPLETIDWLIY